MSFNKLKIPNPFGNKKQREQAKKEGDINNEMGIKIAKLELMEGRYILPYIQKTTDVEDAPNYILQQAQYTTKELTDEVRADKMKFLEDNGIKTIVNVETAEVDGFENIEKE